MLTQEKISNFITRKELPISEKNKVKFYICDYCRMGIEIKNKVSEQDGGEVILPMALMNKKRNQSGFA